jgi:hypothetical protein
MKILSNQAITKDDLSIIDEKQTRQIMQLRVALAASFIVNLAVGLAAFFKG